MGKDVKKGFYHQAAEELAAGLADDALWANPISWPDGNARKIRDQGLAAHVHHVADREARALLQAWPAEIVMLLAIFGHFLPSDIRPAWHRSRICSPHPASGAYKTPYTGLWMGDASSER